MIFEKIVHDMTILQVTQTKLDGVLVIKPPTIFEDHRGSYVELYNQKLYQEAGIRAKFVQDDISTSKKGTLRGIHGDRETWKLISCLYGKLYLVVLDADPTSPRFAQWESFILSDRNRLPVLVPPKYGNGHLVLSARAVFHYKQSAYYNRAKQFTILWNDPRFKIVWGIEKPILSKRDQGADNSRRC